MADTTAGGGMKKSKKPAPALVAWLFPALQNKRKIKTWIRCCVALAVTMILMVDNKTLNSMGQAGFFAAIVAVMLPPSLALSLFIFAALTLLLGMMVGWAWGSAAMAASVSVRSQALLTRQQQGLQSSLQPNISVALQQQSAVYHGHFLDPRSSAVYGAFFFIGTFALGALRAHIPKLALLSIFGSIVLDIICTYGPLFPTTQYTIPKLFLIPTAYYIAIAIASTVLLFPESLNHVWLNILTGMYFQPMLDLLSVQARALSGRPSDHKFWESLYIEGNGYRKKLIAGADLLLGQVGLIDLEISVGRLGPSDLKKISKQLKPLAFRTTALHSFETFVNNVNVNDEEEEKLANEQLEKSRNHKQRSRFTWLRRKIREREVRHGHDLDTLVPILRESSAEIRGVCEASVNGIKQWIEDCNNGRWGAFFRQLNKEQAEEQHANMAKLSTQLKQAILEFRQSGRVQILKPYEQFFDPRTGKLLDNLTNDPQSPNMFAARSLYICFVFVDTIDAFAEQLDKLLTFLLDLDNRRLKPRIWFPSGFGKLGRKLRSSAPVMETPAPIAMGDSSDSTEFNTRTSDRFTLTEQADDTDTEEGDYEENPVNLETKPTRTRRNPDALPPTTAYGKFFVSLGSALSWFKTPQGVFALRHGILSVALWVPAVCGSSAWFYYDNRGLWALIMAQTSLAVFTGDQIAGFFVRIAGTVLGLLLGMATWYIGAGHGIGNPYGVVIATTVLVAPSLLGRIAAPPEQMMLWTMTGVTIVFVVGYSWINSHLVVISNPGIGVHLAWKRALLVIVGFTGSFIVMMFPHPTTGRLLVRRTLSATLGEIGNIFTQEMELFLAEEAKTMGREYDKSNDKKESDNAKAVQRIAKRVLNVIGRLQALEPSLATAKFEPQLQGAWPQEQYTTMHQLQLKLSSSLILLASSFIKLDAKWCSILVHKTPFLNPNFLADLFSKIAILSSSLAGGSPLPPALPALRDRLVYHGRHLTNSQVPFLALNSSFGTPNITRHTEDDDDSSIEGNIDLQSGPLDGSSVGFEELTLELLMDEQVPAHATAVVAMSHAIALVDQIGEIVRELCGEMSFEGFRSFQNEHIEQEEKSLGFQSSLR